MSDKRDTTPLEDLLAGTSPDDLRVGPAGSGGPWITPGGLSAAGAAVPTSIPHDIRVPGPPTGLDDEARGLTRGQILRAVRAEREAVDRHPVRAEVAYRLHTSEATLKRAMQELDMGRWPPAVPDSLT